MAIPFRAKGKERRVGREGRRSDQGERSVAGKLLFAMLDKIGLEGFDNRILN